MHTRTLALHLHLQRLGLLLPHHRRRCRLAAISTARLPLGPLCPLISQHSVVAAPPCQLVRR